MATNITNSSRICLTSFNISWDTSNNSITCGDVSYEVSISPPPIEGNAVTTTVNRFFSVTGLNNTLRNVTVTVTARNRAGQGEDSTFSVELPRKLSMCYIAIQNLHACTYIHTATYIHTYLCYLFSGCIFICIRIHQICISVISFDPPTQCYIHM